MNSKEILSLEKIINFSTQLYSLDSQEMRDIESSVDRMVHSFHNPEIKTALIVIIKELITNALKAVHKNIFLEHVVDGLGIANLSYSDKLELFRAETDTHHVKNFSRVAREYKLYVTCTMTVTSNGIQLVVENPFGVSEIESARVTDILQKSKTINSLSSVLERTLSLGNKEVFKEEYSEGGAGLGLAFVIMSVKSMGIPVDNLVFDMKQDRTIVTLFLPLQALLGRKITKIQYLEDIQSFKKFAYDLVSQLGYYIIVFTSQGDWLYTSKNFIQDYNLSMDIENLKDIIPEQFFKDVFNQDNGIIKSGRIDNYRLWCPLGKEGKQSTLFNICGYFEHENSMVLTLWIPIFLAASPDKKVLKAGDLMETAGVHKFLRPYLSSPIIEKAYNLAKSSGALFASQTKIITVLFGDIVGFTHIAEMGSPQEAVNFLNVALGILVRNIDVHSGYVDKFMGDAIMGIFDDALNAVIAAAQIQSVFRNLNTFRTASGHDKIEVRIGLNTGHVILSDIGTETRKDWTAIGDTVNVASRLEHQAKPGEIIISDTTHNVVKDNTRCTSRGEIKLKGKKKLATTYKVNQVFYSKGKETITIDLY